MRRTIWVTAIAFTLAMALCITASASVTRVVNHARHLRTQAIQHMDAQEIQAAEETLVQLASYLKDNGPWLEMLCEHEDLHEIKSHIIDAQASIEFGIEDDFYQAIYKFGENLEHIADVETLKWGNLY